MPTNAPLVARRKLIGATIETTKGTAATVSAALDGAFSDVVCEPVDLFSEGERRAQGAHLGTSASVLGMKAGRLTFRHEWRHGDAFATLAQACGFELATGVLTPKSDITLHKSLTFKVWEGGRVKTIIGAMGTFSIEPGGPGQRVFINWEFSGIWVDPADDAMPSQAPITGQPYRAAGVVLTFGGSSLPQISTWNLNVNNEVEPRQDILQASGIKHYIVSDRGPTITLDPEARLVAQHDAYGDLADGVTGALQMVLTGAGGTMTIDAARAQRTGVADATRDNKLTDDLTLALHASSGDDDLVFTEA